MSELWRRASPKANSPGQANSRMRYDPEEIIQLPYTPPYDWQSILSFYKAHQLPHLEHVSAEGYERIVEAERGLAWFRVEALPDHDALLLITRGFTRDELTSLGAKVRSMFDLDASPAVLGTAMQCNSALSAIWRRNPGQRIARAFSGFESIFTTVLGQLVSVSFGRTLVEELMNAAGALALHPKTKDQIALFPSADQILRSDLSTIRTSELRRQTIVSLAQAFKEHAIRPQEQSAQELRKALRSISGIGAWTTEYALLRGFGDDDAFPSTDYVLKRALKRYPNLELKKIRPWRGYGAVALWRDVATWKAATPGTLNRSEE